MKKICVLFGGASPEHDVSIITGLQLADCVKSKYDVEKVYLGLDNNFYLVTQLTEPCQFLDKSKKYKRVIFQDGSLFVLSRFGVKKICDIDCVINCCHGGVGENGDLAGYMELNKIRMTSADTLSSHIAMDKSLTKQLVQLIDVPVIKGFKITQGNLEKMKDLIENELNENLIVKPNSLGSSIGVKACGRKDYSEQIEAIFLMHDDVLVENRVLHLSEYNQACYMRDGKLVLSAIEEPVLKSGILSFDDKYMTANKTKGGDRVIPANIPKSLADTISEYTGKIYSCLNMNGVARIDYIYDKEAEKLYFNEINTIPGSMAFYLYEPLGIDYISFVGDLIANAREIKKYSYFDTGVLSKKLH